MRKLAETPYSNYSGDQLHAVSELVNTAVLLGEQTPGCNVCKKLSRKST